MKKPPLNLLDTNPVSKADEEGRYGYAGKRFPESSSRGADERSESARREPQQANCHRLVSN